MTTEAAELTPRQTARWPATPDHAQWYRARTSMAVVQGAMIVRGHPRDGKPKAGAYLIDTPRGETVRFDTSHEAIVIPPQRIIMNRNKVRSAQNIHNCLQSAVFTQECENLFDKVRPEGQEEDNWFLHTAAELGDSVNTIGVAVQRAEPDDPGKGRPTLFKLTRSLTWMGFNLNLQNLKGLTFWIYGAEDTDDLPSYAIGCRGDMTPDGANLTEVRPNMRTQTGMLAKIFRYHGAERSLWIPRT